VDRKHILAALLLIASAMSGCGKSSIVAVKRPAIAINVCQNVHDEGYDPCPGLFDVGRIIGLRLPAAEKLAESHGYKVRSVAPLGEHEALTADFESNRLDVECDSTSRDCIVVRYVERG
jgi:hypothetical protein